MIFLELFISFFKIGIFGFGGGYAMLSLIQTEVVISHQWITNSGFADIVALSQMTPGPISINCATYIGYTATSSVWGATVATLGLCMPSLILMILGSYFFIALRGNIYVKTIMRALRPVVIALIGAAALILCTKDNFSDYTSYLIFVGSLVLVLLKVNPIFVILIAGFTGYLIY